MVEQVSPEIPPAPDVLPENAFDPLSFAQAFAEGMKKAGAPAFSPDQTSSAIVNSLIQFLAVTFKDLIPLIQAALADSETAIETLGKLVLALASPVLSVLKDTIGGLTRTYVDQVVGDLQGVSRGSEGRPGLPAGSGAQAMFDSILAPLGMVTGQADPAQPNAGFINSQYLLGSLVSLHLSTFAINVVSNLTGLGFLHWINSFDDVILAAMNTRGMSRAAFKPYLETYLSEPTTRDLNIRHQLKDPGPVALIKTFVRGGLTPDQIRVKMAERGFSPDVTAQLLLDTVRELSLADVAYLVNHNLWTDEQAVQYLENIGWPSTLANIPLGIAKQARAVTQHELLADELVTAVATRRIDPEGMRKILTELGFSELEVNAFAVRAAARLEFSKPLSIGQVKDLFGAGLVDLTYVQRFLAAEGYSSEDQHLLILLEFTKAEDRQIRSAELGALAAVQSIELAAQAASAATKGESQLAAAKTRLSKRKAARAALLGQ